MLSGHVTNGADHSDALLDPEAEQLLADSRQRVERRLTQREQLGETVAAVTFLAVAAAMVVALPSHRTLELTLMVALVAGYALASRIRFDVRAEFTDVTQLVLVPMLFLLPAEMVPLLVAAGYILGDLPDYLAGRRHIERVLMSLGNSWYAVGPAVVIAIASPDGALLADWYVYLGALAAQFAFDVIATTPRQWFELGVSPRSQLQGAGWTFAVDTLLSPLGFLTALAAVDQPYLALLALPALGLFAIFARERQARLESALQLGDAFRGTTMVLADLLETDDEYTGLHSRDVVALAVDVADELGLSGRSKRTTECGALLHDIGKIAVPKEIINKPGPLTVDEWEIIRVHTVEGQRILDRIGGVLREVGQVVRSSHERWDGAGYPDGLAGEEIPIESRIVSCCDSFNAMTTHRSYRAAMPLEDALAELRAGAGSQFDPLVAEALSQVLRRAAPAPAAADRGREKAPARLLTT